MIPAVQTIDQGVVRAAESRPDGLALVDAPNRESLFHGSPQRWSWAELDGAVEDMAATLGSLGVEAGGRVAVQLPNVVELVTTILACARTGAVVVPFPIQHRQHELTHGLALTGASVMITGSRPDRPGQVDDVLGVCGTLERAPVVAVFGPCDTAGVVPLDMPASGPGSRPTSARAGAGSDLVSVCWTSGTTGTPKGVPRTNSMWLASARFQIDQLGLGADDRILCPFPVVNMAGIGGMLVPWALTGSTLCLHHPLDLGVFLAQLADEEITYTVAPPALLNRLLADESLPEGLEFPALRKISSGSAPLDPWMVSGWHDRGIEIVNVFGSNEGASLLSTAATVPDPVLRARCFPRPDRPGVETRLVDLETGDDIEAPGRVGELRFRGDTVFDGYLESTGEEFDELGFYRTGDLFEWVDEPGAAGLLKFVDRAKDIIIRGGMNVSAAEVEALVSSHDSVLECAAVAFPDRDLGERVGVFVVPAGGVTPTLELVVEHLRSLGLASYKLPERLEVLDALPRNPVGKVTKPELRARWVR